MIQIYGSTYIEFTEFNRYVFNLLVNVNLI